MPVHDWSLVDAGIFHHFHGSWINEISRALNAGLLPSDFYALTEQVAGEVGPDVLTLRGGSGNGSRSPQRPGNTSTLTLLPPKVRFTAEVPVDPYVLKQRAVVIRHVSGDRVIALIEILSPGNKGNWQSFRAFLDKAVSALAHGYHLLLIDLHPPSRRDPQGIHGVLWAELSDDPYTAPTDKPLTAAAYTAGPVLKAFVEPFALGDPLPDMPLFLDPETYVSISLEKEYLAAWQDVPERWRSVLEGA